MVGLLSARLKQILFLSFLNKALMAKTYSEHDKIVSQISEKHRMTDSEYHAVMSVTFLLVCDTDHYHDVDLTILYPCTAHQQSQTFK